MRPGTLLRWYALKGILKPFINVSSVILDIGGFDGYMLHDLSPKLTGKDITVIDPDISGLKTAREGGMKVLGASALDLPLKDNHADLILCLDLLEHVDNDRGVIHEVSRVLKNKGTLVVTTPMKRGVSFPFLGRDKIEKINRSWGHVRLGYGHEEIRKLFHDGGFTIIRISRYFNLITRLIYRFTFLSTRFRFSWYIYETVLKLEPYIKFNSQEYIIIAIKQ